MLTIDATNLPRFMACNGSRSMGGFVPPMDDDYTSRDEGNAAHDMARLVHSGQFTATELVDRKAANGVFYTSDMAEHVQQYLDAIGNQREELISSSMEIETTFSGDIWCVPARCDHIGYAVSGTLYIDDLKYGWRLVDPEMNWTLIAHAIGHCINRGFQPHTIVLTIHQPRPHHPEGKSRSWTIDYARLSELYFQIARTMSAPSDETVTGYHCHGCKGLTGCLAAMKAQFNAIEAASTIFHDDIDNDQLALRLDTLKRAQSTIKTAVEAFEELAKYRLRQGQIVGEYSAEPSLGNRTWVEGVTVDFMRVLTGVNLAKKAQMDSPAQAERLNVPEAVIKALTYRPPTGTKLTRISADKRAKRLFGDKKGK